jgi:hypothetical protein
MVWRLTRFWALALAVFLLGAQVHVWVESAPGQTSGHVCQFCLSGAWAVVSVHPGLELALRTLRLESQPSQPVAKSFRSGASAPRAPPQA